MKTIKFELNEEESKAVYEFLKKHRETCFHGSAGDQFEYTFLPTGLGLFTTVECLSCKSEIDIDCDGNITYKDRASKLLEEQRRKISNEARAEYSRRKTTTLYDMFDFIPLMEYAIRKPEYITIYEESGVSSMVDEILNDREKLEDERIGKININD